MTKDRKNKNQIDDIKRRRGAKGLLRGTQKSGTSLKNQRRWAKVK